MMNVLTILLFPLSPLIQCQTVQRVVIQRFHINKKQVVAESHKVATVNQFFFLQSNELHQMPVHADPVYVDPQNEPGVEREKMLRVVMMLLDHLNKSSESESILQKGQ